VDLPAPLRPIKATRSPGAIDRSTPRKIAGAPRGSTQTPRRRSADLDADRAGGTGEDDFATPLAKSPRPVTGPARHAAGPADVEPTPTGGSVTALPQRPAELGTEMDDGDLWIATLERHVDRAQREGGGLALLRVELVDGERLAASAGPSRPRRTVAFRTAASRRRFAVRSAARISSPPIARAARG